jgi:hypothetical protein
MMGMLAWKPKRRLETSLGYNCEMPASRRRLSHASALYGVMGLSFLRAIALLSSVMFPTADRTDVTEDMLGVRMGASVCVEVEAEDRVILEAKLPFGASDGSTIVFSVPRLCCFALLWVRVASSAATADRGGRPALGCSTKTPALLALLVARRRIVAPFRPRGDGLL